MRPLHTFVIRRAFVIPLGLLILLTIVLFAVCLQQGQPVAKLIILAGMLMPLAVLFVECAWRRIVVDAEGVTAHRLLRKKRMAFQDVTSLESVRVRSRVFLTLVAGDDDFLIISNSYGAFPRLFEVIAESVPPDVLTDDTRQLLNHTPVRQADVVTAWFAVIVMIYVLLAQFRS